MGQNEIIRLDARVVGVIAQSVFRAKLGNGHEIVAYAGRENAASLAGLAVGDRVRVELSPFDMSKGKILVEEDREFENESKKFSEENL